LATGDGAGHDADVGDDAAIGIEDGVENGGAEVAVVGDGGRGDEADDGLKDLFDADAHFGGGGDGFVGGELEDVFELAFGFFDIGVGEVDLVDDGDDVEVLLHRQVEVGDGLSLDALGGIDEEEGAFAGGEGAGDFVAEVDVAGGIEEIEFVDFAVFGGVLHGDGVGLDGDAAFAFEVHGVEHLVLLLPVGDGVGELQEAVGQGGLAVIDVGDDGEIARQFCGHSEGGRGRWSGEPDV
jgi:hypothetical protein